MGTILAWAIVAATACGDNLDPSGEPLEAASDLTIVAHQDDDLLFMQPDLYDAVQRGTGVTNVYVTAGNGHRGFETAVRRYRGLRAAYSALTGESDWSCGRIVVAAHEVVHCRLDDAKLSLIFVGYPDGGKDGESPNSLIRLWDGSVAQVDTVSRVPTSYRRDELVAVLAAIVDATAPSTVRTLDLAASHGHDHADHSMVGALALAAVAASAQSPELIAYRGYNVADEPANAAPALLARGLGVLAYYEACSTDCGRCGAPCGMPAMDPVHLAWAARHYAIGMRRTPSGVLRLGERCVDATSGTPVMVDCAAAPAWTLDSRGALRSAAGCLRAELGGSVGVTSCGLGALPGDKFWLDDEGHLWSGMVPAAVEVGPLSHVSCLRVDQDRLRTHACSGSDAPVWEIAGTMTLPDGGADHVARWVADLDGDHQPDWCAASPAGPMCSLASDSSVTTTPSAWGYALGGRVQDSAGDDSLPEPDAAVMTDIDGDGRADLCSVHDGKVACARSLGHGFGPRAVVARLPAGMTASALWAEPAQLCAGDGATTACIGKP